jgi:hypothetical protein
LLGEQAPEESPDARTSTPEDVGLRDDEPDEEPTRGPAPRHARMQQAQLARPMPSLRTARIQSRLGTGLVVLGALVLSLAVLVIYKRTRGAEEQPRTVALVLPEARSPQVTPIVSASAPAVAAQAPAHAAPEPRAQPNPTTRSDEASVEAHGPAREPTPERKRATLLIASPAGWAEIYLGGKLLGTTPGKFKLSEGTHTLLVKPGGKSPGYTKKVSVKEGSSNKLIL